MENEPVTPKIASKELATIPRNVVEEEIANENLSHLVEVLEENLDPVQIKAIKAIGYSIGRVGASVKDACFLARVTKEDLDKWINELPDIKTYLDLKRIEYKYKLLEIVSGQALENKDVKLATQLLELQFAEEYNPSVKRELAKASRNAEEDVMDIAIAIVRRGAAHSMPINPQNGLPDAPTEEIKYQDVAEVIK